MDEMELEQDTPVEVAPGVLKPYGDCTAQELEGAVQLLRASGGDRIPDPAPLREEEWEAHVAAEKPARDQERARIAARIRLIEDKISSRIGPI